MLPFLLLSCTLLLSPVVAWVPRIELVSKRGKISSKRLKATENDDDTIDAYRKSLERRFSSSYGDHAHDFFSEASLILDDEDDWIEAEWSEESTRACGEDCEVSETLIHIA